MHFTQSHIYHIYNQGNNRQPIFFDKENYLFFLKKIKEYICPYAEILAWCLMSNHFHLIVLVKCDNLSIGEGLVKSDSLTLRETIIIRLFNDSIGLMLRSYTRAINNRQNRTGSLFRKETKAECITKIEGVSPFFYNANSGTIINISKPEFEYPKICFDYIHQNLVKSGLVKNAEDWQFSSFQDYCGLLEGKLVNKELAKKWNLIY